MSVTQLNERREAERASFTFPVRTSTGIIGETVNLSFSGLRLALERPLLSTRSIPIQVDFPLSPSFESHVEVVWNKPNQVNNRFLCGAKFLRLKKEEKVLLEEALHQSNILDSNFTLLTAKMRDWLVDFKAKCDQFDLMYPFDSDRNQFVEKNKLNLEVVLNTYFKNIWKIFEDIKLADHSINLRYYRKMLNYYLVDLIEIGRFMCRKPLGYAGDFMIMNYFYDYCYKHLGESSYEKSINCYTCNVPIAFSVVERKDFFKEKILEALRNNDSARILSVASGSARELTELAEEGKIIKPLYFDCLDVEPKAFEYIKKMLEKIQPENKRYLHIRFLQADFLNIIKGRKIKDLFEKYNFIYSSGLFDYLSDRMARRVVFYLFSLLEKHASLIVTNANDDDYHRSYYEMLDEWKLIHRNGKEMLNWASEIKENCLAELINFKTEKPFMFLILSLQKISGTS